MTPRDPDLDELTSLLGECLGRIDEQAYRLQEHGEDGSDYGTADLLEDAAANLQELVDALLVVDCSDDRVDVNQLVERTADAAVEGLSIPILFRRNLVDAPVEVTAPASYLKMAVQRAFTLATGSLAAGGELLVTTRVEGGAALVEIECLGTDDDLGHDTAVRAETLRAFVGDLGGRCDVRTNNDQLLLVLELPKVMATDRSESDEFA